MATSRVTNGKAKSPDRYSDHNAPFPVVYFLSIAPTSSPDDFRIKIGKSDGFARRLLQHRQAKLGFPFNVEPLCVVPADGECERKVLRYFDYCRVDGEAETFMPSDGLLGYIRWLREKFFVWIPDCEQCPALEDLTQEDPSHWLPEPGRVTAPPPQMNFWNELGPLRMPPREKTKDDFYTNRTVIECARASMGGIDLDPASHAIANTVVRAAHFYTKATNGLRHPWGGRVWLNPPFSRLQEWVPKIITEIKRGDVEAMCMFCATRTLTAQYFEPIHRAADALCIITGRVKCWGGFATDSPDDGHAVFYFGRDVDRFIHNFSDIGCVTVSPAKD